MTQQITVKVSATPLKTHNEQSNLESVRDIQSKGGVVMSCVCVCVCGGGGGGGWETECVG